MRNTLLLPLALVTVLGACSGDSAPTFSDPIAAMDTADSAKAAGDSSTAKAGYDFALQNGDDTLKGDAMIGLFELNLADNDEAAAKTSFARLSSDFSASLTEAEISRLIDMTVFAKMADLGEIMLGYAVGTFPSMKDSLANASNAIELIKTQGPGVDLSTLGYAGD